MEGFGEIYEDHIEIFVKKIVYTKAQQSAQVKLRSMKENWRMHESQELQDAADQHDMKRFYDDLKTVYRPLSSGSALFTL